MSDLRELQRMLDRAARELPNTVTTIIEVEGLNFIQKNFEDQGYNDTGLEEWEERKTADDRGRDITRYRTNRVGRQGNLNRYGSRNKDRAILTGHETGGNKLRNSIRARKTKNAVRFFTSKEYAQRHNEGLDGMPQRQFMGKSKYFEDQIKAKLKRTLDRTFR
ncbi:phage morphogenesis protein [Flavobacterium sp. DG1-102-2]|uniref:phage morphogenesis protein n=1 Tax=Flavobacterium sp. DG1-102-2 TaxID=3081663 RepID=UPI0029496C47|nr:phage morphogenesis protein [Flavobacterium sp. DG1-102-2]MDV6170221.1 phage morphogenesis protein [Flavobacterium sp. DG1-102-2]